MLEFKAPGSGRTFETRVFRNWPSARSRSSRGRRLGAGRPGGAPQLAEPGPNSRGWRSRGQPPSSAMAGTGLTTAVGSRNFNSPNFKLRVSNPRLVSYLNPNPFESSSIAGAGPMFPYLTFDN